MLSTVTGIYDVLNSMAVLARAVPDLPQTPPFTAEVVTETETRVKVVSGLSLSGRPASEVQRTNIIIAPSLMPASLSWEKGRHEELVRWIRRMHEQGSVLVSACTGLLLLGETGLFDGRQATLHPQLLEICRQTYPEIDLRPEHVLVTDGAREQFVSSGGATTWHDLVLYLITRYTSAAAAVEMARFFALKAHDEGQALYSVFVPPFDHGDAMVRDAQHWLARHLACETPVEAVVAHSGMAPRTFKRRFRAATGFSPMGYVQRLRVEEAKRCLERTRDPVEEIGARVGYVDPAFFRRLFKRVTMVSPAVYRQQMKLPDPYRHRQ
ncbi:transcriptional regulator [Maritimibacter sp. 55A14]|nr:transcriptional regulator [Maritimibacter sp. 55A14]